jgi:UDP-3-O-acyl-N-acetylglucosamine deacetylase
MSQDTLGRILSGSVDDARRARERFDHQPMDWDLLDGTAPLPPQRQKTLARPVSVAGRGTFLGKAHRTLQLEPTELDGWWFLRDDLPDSLPIRVSVRNVWTTGDIVSNIVLRSGPPQNYVRMVEHIVALKLGLDVDNLLIRMESGDPPLFDRGSMDLVETMESGGTVESDSPVRHWTVKERVSVCTAGGSFLTLAPAVAGDRSLTIDCAIDFPTAIGRQRIRFRLDRERFKYGAQARTNTSFIKMLYCKTIGKIFADIRHLGYTMNNIVVASRWGYINEPRLLHNGKSLEAVWHRAILDLLAALALIEDGRFCGHVDSYRAGHALDCLAVRLLYKHQLLKPV